MGACGSSMTEGKEAIGGGGADGHNDAVEFFYKNHGLRSLFTQIELSLSASKLLDLDVVSKSDPMAVVYAKKKDGVLEELGRTEVISNSLSPEWIQKINIAYQFEIIQPLVFRIYDVDTKYHNANVKSLKLKDQDFLGEANCVLSEIVTKQNRSLTLKLHRSGRAGAVNSGTITIHAEETVATRNAVEIVFRCSKLDNKDLFSKSDPFLRVSRIVENAPAIPICKTEVVNNNLNPTWKPLTLTMQQFVSKDNPLILECFDFNSDGNHAFLGKIHKSVSELETLYKDKTGVNFTLPPSRTRNREKVLKGQLFVDRFVEKKLFSFLDYISSGFELNFMVAVDFTASNGDPRNPSSLHYIDHTGRPNAYQQAIREVGEVIQFYDSDRLFPAWGFGGKTYEGSVSHCFNLNSSGYEVEGVEGIMAAYARSLQTVSLSGPTLFGQVINTAAEIAGKSLFHNNNKYFVLLIITDGVLTDLQGTIEALVKASDLPLSVLIVGVGNADFTQMEILDGDKKRLESSSGRVATRDIVQFVPMREVHKGQLSIVQSLLEELPGQFLTYMRSRDIKPLPAASVPSAPPHQSHPLPAASVPSAPPHQNHPFPGLNC